MQVVTELYAFDTKKETKESDNTKLEKLGYYEFKDGLPVLFLLHDDPLLLLSGKGIAVNDAVFDRHLMLCLCCAAVSYTQLHECLHS